MTNTMNHIQSADAFIQMIRPLALPFLIMLAFLMFSTVAIVLLLSVDRFRKMVRKTLWMAIEALDDGALTGSSSKNNQTVRGVRFQTGAAGYDAVFGSSKPASIESKESDLIDPDELQDLFDEPLPAWQSSWANKAPTELISFEMEIRAHLSTDSDDPHAMSCDGFETTGLRASGQL